MKKNVHLLTGILFLTLLTCAIYLALKWNPPKPASIQAIFTDQSIVLDGKLDDKAWSQTTWSSDLKNYNGEGYPDKGTQVKILYDKSYLYFAFKMADEDLINSYKNRDEPIYEQDVVEVFLDPDDDQKNYYEFQVSPGQVYFDALFPSYREDLENSKKWNADLKSGVFLEGTLNKLGDTDKGWVVELAIPFSDLKHAPRTPPQSGDKWRMNLFRINKTTEALPAFGAWSPPVVGDFHKLDRFGYLEFK